MKTLIQRDLCIYLPIMIYLSLVLTGLLAAISHDDKGFIALLLISCIIGLMNSVLCTFRFDTQDKCNVLLRAMPVPAQVIVASRYLSCLLSSILCGTVFSVMTWLRVVCSIKFPSSLHALPVEIRVYPSAFIASMAVMLLVCAVILPLAFLVKTQIIGWIYLCIPMISIFQTISQFWDMLLWLPRRVLYMGWRSYLLFVISLAVLAASMWLSVRIFKAREE